eukprot:CAMPEP_0197023024 /NCGR_PEP_ID=MMETSP1384-20130603/3807_1 /TAXON_ID=29189 /ORGANISM="Ammonia sp." /LENGTH=269 /DNA_ID=CAMNT_0042451167 /DNA_START=29 /DNA_END=838 /DNA_ORIENTATION=+
MIPMKILCFVLYYLSSNLESASAQCTWSDSSGNVLNLGCLNGQMKTAEDTASTPHVYQWSLCSNGTVCNEKNVMVCQYQQENPDDQKFILGRWDPDVQPSFDGNRSWTFEYENGDTDCGPRGARAWVPTFECDHSTEWAISTVEETPGSCLYRTTITTKYACLGQTYACSQDESSSGISGGWIFIIVLISAFMCYCCIGYVVMATTKNKAGGFADFQNNIPQKQFWTVLPKLVIAGCLYSKDAMMGLFNKDKGGGDEKAEPMAQEETSQ